MATLRRREISPMTRLPPERDGQRRGRDFGFLAGPFFGVCFLACAVRLAVAGRLAGFALLRARPAAAVFLTAPRLAVDVFLAMAFFLGAAFFATLFLTAAWRAGLFAGAAFFLAAAFAGGLTLATSFATALATALTTGLTTGFAAVLGALLAGVFSLVFAGARTAAVFGGWAAARRSAAADLTALFTALAVRRPRAAGSSDSGSYPSPTPPFREAAASSARPNPVTLLPTGGGGGTACALSSSSLARKATRASRPPIGKAISLMPAASRSFRTSSKPAPWSLGLCASEPTATRTPFAFAFLSRRSVASRYLRSCAGSSAKVR